MEFDVARIDEIEAVTRHDVIAFLTHLAEIVGSDEARFVHQGMDLVGRAGHDLQHPADAARPTSCFPIWTRFWRPLKRRAMEHKMTVRIGRSHGIHAEPVTMGLTFARFYAEMARNRNRLEKARWEIRDRRDFGRGRAPSPTSTPASRNTCCEKLGLRPEPISTQVIPRATATRCSSPRWA